MEDWEGMESDCCCAPIVNHDVCSACKEHCEPLVVHEWVLISQPTPQDEEIYDICLNSKEVIEGVEFWAFGGGFKPLARRVNGKLVAYPLEDVHSFKLHNN